MNSPISNTRIAASVLAADFARLGDDLSAMVDAGVDLFHWDIMDGHFVPNISFGPGVIKSLRKTTDKIFDVHLMVTNPLQWIDALKDAGADSITFHIEANDDPFDVIAKIKQNDIIVGLALNPNTVIEAIPETIFNEIDRVLVMTVQPGFGGQAFIDQSAKIKQLKQKYPKLDIMVDGGINIETAAIAIQAGAKTLVSGNALFSSENKKDYIAKLKGAA